MDHAAGALAPPQAPVDLVNRTVTLVYFAWVREKIGRPREDLALPLEIATVADLIAYLKALAPEYETAFARPEIVRVALDKVHAAASAPLDGVREIAFFPPVTGG